MNLQVNIGADSSQFRRGLQEAENALQDFTRQMDALRGMGESLVSLGTKLSVGLTVPIIGLSTAAVKAYADVEALKLGLGAVVGSAAKAGREFSNLQSVAKLPGLGLEEAVRGSINLQSIGLSASKSRNVLLQFGNAVATVGKGRAEFERAVYGVQQLANTDFPLGEDLNIIKDAIPQVSTLLDQAFGANRSDALAKMGVSSKQVLDAILTGLEKLPRVTGGLKGAFENFGDSVKSSLSRVGDIINQRLNISKIIDKITEALDSLISKFEDLSPGMQKFIIISAGIAAALGPILVGFGGILLILPSITTGITTMAAGWGILSAAMTSATGVIGLLLIGSAALGAAIAIYANSIETASDRQERFVKSQEKATASAQVEIAAVDELYKKTQNLKLGYNERQKAVDDIQKQYPAYFKDIDDEIIKTGGAAAAYRQLRKDILSASLARAAQSELDKRNEKRLESELSIRERMNKLVDIYKNAGDLSKFPKLNAELEKIGGTFGRALSPDNVDKAGIQRAAGLMFNELRNELKARGRAFANEDNPLISIINAGNDAIDKLDFGVDGGQKKKGFDKGSVGEIEERIKKLQEYRKTLQAGSAELSKTDAEIQRLSELISKPKKEAEKQLAEFLPEGSIAELKRRAGLLQKAIESTNNGLVKIRTVDQYGSEKDKKGNPYYTGLVLPIQKAYDELERLKILIGEIDIEPVKIKQDNSVFDSIGIEYKSMNDMLTKEAERTDMILNTKLPNIISESGKKVLEASAGLNENLKGTLNNGLSDSVSSVFEAIGKSFSGGTSLIEAVGTALLSSFGKILGELGKQLISYGVGLLGLKLAMKSLNPYVAIAAGAALVALGAGITASVAKQSNSIGGGDVSTGTGSSTPSYSSAYSSGGGSGGEVVFRISGQDLIGTINRNVAAESRLKS